MKKIIETNLVCAYCGEKRNGSMITQLVDADLSVGYYDDSELDKCTSTIEISCDKCGKLLYVKEITTNGDYSKKENI